MEKRVSGARQGRLKDPLARKRIRRTIAFDAQLYEAIEAMAQESGVSVQWLIQVLLRRITGISSRTDRVLDKKLELGRTRELRRRTFDEQDAREELPDDSAPAIEVAPVDEEDDEEVGIPLRDLSGDRLEPQTW